MPCIEAYRCRAESRTTSPHCSIRTSPAGKEHQTRVSLLIRYRYAGQAAEYATRHAAPSATLPVSIALPIPVALQILTARTKKVLNRMMFSIDSKPHGVYYQDMKNVITFETADSNFKVELHKMSFGKFGVRLVNIGFELFHSFEMFGTFEEANAFAVSEASSF